VDIIEIKHLLHRLSGIETLATILRGLHLDAKEESIERAAPDGSKKSSARKIG
jgi:hypothetical protein